MGDVEEKFFFDQNIFDEDGNIESELIEDEEPPVPTFSEDEMAVAKRRAYNEGHATAKKEAEESHEKHLLAVMDSIGKNMATLFDGEAAREKTYEREAVELTLSIFEKLFPRFYERHGHEEMRQAIKEVIQKQSGQQAVAVKVHPDMVQGINEYLKKLQAQNADILFSVQGDPALSHHGCSLHWENGGGVHDTEAMANAVLDSLKDGLAGFGGSSHDRREENDENSGSLEPKQGENTATNEADTPQSEQTPHDVPSEGDV